MPPRCYLGVDPGTTGAAVLYDPVTEVLSGIAFPTLDIKGKKVIDLHQLAGWFDLYASRIKLATIEQVGAMPKQGLSSTFKFGFATGSLHGLLAAHFVRIQTVTPQKWKARYGLGGDDKDKSRQAASRLFPRYASLWPRKLDHGVAEAALLCHYGYTENYGK